MLKKIVTVILLCALLGTTSVYAEAPAPAENTDEYADDPIFKEGMRNYTSDELLQGNGLVGSTANSTYSPFTETTYYHDARFVGSNYTARLGIDVSSHQGTINWTAVRAAGVEFVMIRAGVRGYLPQGNVVKDSQLDANLAGAKKAGIKVGVYFFSQALTEAEAAAEASATLNYINHASLDLPVVMDYEDEYDTSGNPGRFTGAHLSKAQQTANVEAFCNTVKAAGYSAGVYTNYARLFSSLDGEKLGNECNVWVADWRTTARYGYNYQMWQYADNGSVNGISGPVDCNFWYDGQAGPAANLFTGVTSSDITSTSAVLTATKTLGSVSSCGYRIGTSEASLGGGENENPSGAINKMWYTASGLQPDTTYYYKFYYVLNGTTYWSALGTFKTLNGQQGTLFTAITSSDITAASAVLTATKTLGAVTSCGYRIGTSAANLGGGENENPSGAINKMWYTASGLQPDTTYFYQFYYVLNGTTYRSEISSFKTLTLGKTATPVISPASGEYESGQTVKISCDTSGAKIYYTTDGSTPTAQSTQYSSPFSVTETMTVKAAALAAGYSLSDTASAVLTIKEKVSSKSVRIFGWNRYETAMKIVLKAFPEGSGTVILASGQNWPDALAASALAGAKDCPIVLTNTKSLTAMSASLIRTLKATHVIMVGGTGALSDDIKSTLVSQGLTVERIFGDSRMQTADRIAEAVMQSSTADTCFIVSGKNFPDALSVSAYAYAKKMPVFLTGWDGKLTTETRTEARNFRKAIIIGKENSVSAEVETQLSGLIVKRYGGDSRYETSAMIVNNLYGDTIPSVTVTTGQNFPDALAGAALAGRENGAILLVNGGDSEITTDQQGVLKKTDKVWILGSNQAVSDGIQESIDKR